MTIRWGNFESFWREKRKETNSRRGEIKRWLRNLETNKGPKMAEVGASLAYEEVRRGDRGVIKGHFWPILRMRATRREGLF
jgi:hypothetical protein